MKKLLLAVSLLLMTSFVNAQYLVSATQIANISEFYVKQGLDNQGFNTDSMALNSMRLYKITYNTTDVHGEPTIASGALYVPQIDCDTLPLVSYQHGTVFHKEHVPSNWWFWVPAYLYSGNGYITTLPDYLGMGDNPGIHPYIHWESEATASIDLIRAAREFLNDSLGIWYNNQLFLAGYSQGGHSTMAIHKYIETNNLQNEFNVVASAPQSGAFPLYDVQFPEMFDEDSSYYRAEFIPYALASYQLVYGNLYTNYNEYYDPPYDSIIADWLASGTHTADEWETLIPDNFYDFMQDSVVDNMLNDPDHPVNTDLRENDLHNWIPQEPVRMLYCGMDSMVFAQNSIMAQDTMNALGAPDVQAIDVNPNGIHETCGLPTDIYAFEWFNSLRADCQMVNPICMLNGAEFSTQAEIDNFPSNYHSCIEIAGDVVISGSDITNLDGLSALISIGGDLEIHTNEVLENLSGLDNLESINGSFKAYQNDVLTDFTGIENLGAIDGHLVIAFNSLLNSLAGLDNIEPGSIDNLTISNNDKLSYCEVESICEYLVTSEGKVNIHDNAPGCNSQDEVELACTVSVDEVRLSDKLFIFPNPVKDIATFSSEEIISFELYDMTGSLIIRRNSNKVNISNLNPGIYFVIGFDRQNFPLYKGKVIKD